MKNQTGFFKLLYWRKNKAISHEGVSLSKRSLRQFLKNHLALGAAVIILLTGLVSILGYLISPDSSPFANTQTLEIASKKPGFTVEGILVRRNEAEEKSSWFNKMLFGEKSKDFFIPINQYGFEDEWIILESYTDESMEKGLEKRIHIADVAFALQEGEFISFNPESKLLEFTTIEGDQKQIHLKEIISNIEKSHIVKKRFLLGTDRMGRDMLSQLIIGARVSFSVGFVAVFISLIVGLFFGGLAGFFRGWVDDVILWFINVIWSVPTLLLAMAITFALGKGFWQVFIAIGLTMWVEVARVARGQIISIREKEYIEATRALGLPVSRIIFKHVLPNISGSLIVISAANFASAILLEAGLSFLGIGVQPPMPSWGTMIKDHYGYIILEQAHLAILPGLAIILLVLAFMVFGNGLRDAMDSRSQG